MKNLLLTETQTSEYLGHIPVRTLQRWRLEGQGPKHCKIGKAVRYRQSDLETFVNDNVRQSTSEKGAA
jgi:predicted DNA-binding transcriptional regulator AlpA